MTRIGIHELRQKANEYVHRARRGESIEILDGGTPVAMLVPLPVRRGESLLDELEAQGRLAQRVPTCAGPALLIGPGLPGGSRGVPGRKPLAWTSILLGHADDPSRRAVPVLFLQQ
jgi:prevent-host-death family protein